MERYSPVFEKDGSFIRWQHGRLVKQKAEYSSFQRLLAKTWSKQNPELRFTHLIKSKIHLIIY
jgi:hypothetical protein